MAFDRDATDEAFAAQGQVLEELNHRIREYSFRKSTATAQEAEDFFFYLVERVAGIHAAVADLDLL